MENNYLTTKKVAEKYIGLGYKKAHLKGLKQFLFAVLAGAFIAMASQGSNAAIHTIDSIGLAKTLAGALFSTGLILVVLTEAELFTGGCLLVISTLKKKISIRRLLRSWLIVYTGNFAGALLIVFFILYSGQLNFSDGLLGGFTIKTAVYKTTLSFGNALFLGILCNWLVCLAVWLALSANDIIGKIFGIFFPIWLFITSGFEHSIANMYYVPAGILAKNNPAWVEKAINLGVTSEKLAYLEWHTFIMSNLIPVTLGNIIGGGVFVGIAYWYLYLRDSDRLPAEGQ